MSAPVRVGGGFIEIKPKLDQPSWDKFKTDFTAKLGKLGEESAKALAKGINVGLSGSMDKLVTSTNKATTAIANLSAKQATSFASVQRSAASLAATNEKTAAREQKAAETTAKVKINAEKAAAKSMVISWTDAYGKTQFLAGEFDKLQKKFLKNQLGAIQEVSTTEMRVIKTVQYAKEVAFKKRLAEIAAEAKARALDNSEYLIQIKEQELAQSIADKARKAALLNRNSAAIAALKAEEAAENQAANDALTKLKLKSEAQRAFHARKMADIEAEKVAEGNAIKQIIADYKVREAQRVKDWKAAQTQAAQTLAMQKKIADANVKGSITADASGITRATKSVENYTHSLHGMASTLTQAGHALTFAFSGPLLLAAGYAIKTGVAFTDLKNRTTAAIAAFRGQDVAKGIVDTITKLGTQMPVAIEDMYQLAQRLSSLKTNAAPVTAEVEAFSRAIAAHHLSVTQANRSMIQFQHIVMGYNVNAKELNTLTMDGIPAWDLLSRAMGKSVAQLKEMSKAGTLLSSEVTPKLVAFLNTNKQYADSIKASGESLQGAWIRLKNIFKIGMADDPNSTAVKGLAKSINDFSTSLQDNMPTIQNFLGKVIHWVTQLVNWVGEAIRKFNELPTSVKKGVSSFLIFGIALGPMLRVAGALTHIIGSVRIVIGWLSRMRVVLAAVGLISGESNPVGWIITGIIALGAVIAVAWKNSYAFRTQVGYVWTSLKQLGSTISESLGPIWNGLKSAFSGSGNAAKSMGDYLSLALKKISFGIDWLNKNWPTFATTIVVGFQTWADITSKVLAPALSAVWDLLKSLFNAARVNIGALGDLGTSSKKVADETHGVTVEGGTLGKVVVWLMTAFQGFGKVLVGVISIVKVMVESFAGMVGVVSNVAALLFDVFSLQFLSNPGLIKKRMTDIGGAIVSGISGVASAAASAASALGDMFSMNFGDMYAKNASTFNNIFSNINQAANSGISKPTPKGGGSTTKDPATGGTQTDPNASSKAAKAAKAAQALADRITAARDNLVNALKDFQGSITGSASQINTATKALESKVTSAFDVLKKHDQGQQLVTYLRGVNTRLQALAKQRDAINKAIADNTSYRSSVTSNAMGTATMNNLTFSPTNAYGIKYGLQERLAQIKNFTSQIKKLAAKGLNKTLLREVIDAGPIDGSALAASLLQADEATLKAINSAQSNIDKASKDLGNTAGDMLFGSLDALKKKGKSLQDQMDRIAKDAIDKVGRAFGIGWKTLNSITGTGITEVTATMTSGLTKTTASVTSATANIKQSWTGMISAMNTATGQLVNVTYTQGVKGTVDAMAKIAGAKSPAPTLKYSLGGVVPGYAPRRDTVPAMLSPGEGVLVPELTRQIGPGRLGAWNEAARKGGNVFASGGIVNGGDWIKAHETDPALTSYDKALSGALSAVVDPTLTALAKLAGSATQLESGDARTSESYLHTWANQLDKLSNMGGNAGAVLNIARKEIGTRENPDGSNHTKYSPVDEQWCADFISWVVNQSHSNGAYFGLPVGQRWPAVNTWIAKGRQMPATQAQPGDVAYYNTGGVSHVNLVEKNLGGGKVFAVGGNQSNAVSESSYSPDGVLRPNLPKTNGVGVNPWPGSFPSMGGAGGALGGGLLGGSPSANKALGQKMSSSMGWGSYWSELDQLWTRESRWDNNAENPSSHAFGIPQSLPWTKMPKAAWPTRAGGSADASTQIGWGLNYIRNRYNNPAKAWAHEQGIGWYDKGAWSLKRDQLAMVHAGEMIIPKTPASAIRNAISSGKATPNGNGGTTYDLTINAAPNVPTEQTLRRTLGYFDAMYGG